MHGVSKRIGQKVFDSDKWAICVIFKNFHLACDMYDANNETHGWSV